MRLTTMTQITVDGVVQGNGHATPEEHADGFVRDGWAMGVFADDTADFITETYERADAFLFGRRTFEMFRDTWGAVGEMRTHPIGGALDRAPKYLASNTVAEPSWGDTTVLSGDVASDIRALTAEREGELQVHGSAALIRWLLANDLVDEMVLLTVPVVLGQGARLFPSDGPDVALDLLECWSDARGVTIQRYRPAGRPEYRPNRFD